MSTSQRPPSQYAAGPRLRTLLDHLDSTLLRLAPAKAIIASLVAANLLVVTGAAAPFVLYHGFGPQTFDDLDAGVTLPDPIPQASPDDKAAVNDRIAPDIPLNLSDSVRVTLLFSVGSKGVDAEQAQRLRVNDLGSRGNDGLTDVMMLLLADPETGEVALVSVPRDLWLFARGHRINASYNRHGTQAFVQDMANLVGLPIHHVVEVNFLAFADLVDDLGGVALRVDRPLADLNSVLYVPQAGCWRFSGADALAYVRSRHTLTKGSGGWRLDNSASDHGRMARQRTVLGAAWESVRGPRIVTKIPDLLAAARNGLKVDADLGVQAARALAEAFSDVSAGNMEGYSIPTYGQRIGRAAAQVVDGEAARPIIERLRSWPPSAQDGPTPTDQATATGPATVGSAPIALAARQTLEIDPTCTLADAQPLPSPHAPLASIATSGNAPPPRGTAEPSDTPSGGADPQPSQEPSPPPSDDPSEDGGLLPDHDPSDDESEDGGILPLPDPFDD